MRFSYLVQLANIDTVSYIVSMDDQFLKDENSAKVDYVVPESGPGEEAMRFSAKAQQEKFLAGGASANMEGKIGIQEPPQGTLKPENEILQTAEAGLPSNAEASLNQALEEDRKPGEPKISVNIFYSPHASAKDMEGLKKEFEKCDIYMPERVEWTEGTLDIFKRLSSGKMNPSEVAPDKDPVIQQRESMIDNMIFNSQKPIALIDVPENHQIIKDEENRQSQNKGKKIFHYGNFQDTLDSLKNALKSEYLQEQRETYMLSQLKPQVETVLNEHPELKDKQEIKVLLSLGADHRPLYHSLKKENLQVTRTFSENPFVYPFSLEVVRRNAFGRPVENELVGQALTEILLWKAFRPHLVDLAEQDSQKVTVFTRKLISVFSPDEIKKMYEGASKFEEWPALFLQGLKEKGLKIPNTKQEMDDFLAKPITPQEKAGTDNNG